jgi:hypothetical protein
MIDEKNINCIICLSWLVMELVLLLYLSKADKCSILIFRRNALSRKLKYLIKKTHTFLITQLDNFQMMYIK